MIHSYSESSDWKIRYKILDEDYGDTAVFYRRIPEFSRYFLFLVYFRHFITNLEIDSVCRLLLDKNDCDKTIQSNVSICPVANASKMLYHA